MAFQRMTPVAAAATSTNYPIEDGTIAVSPGFVRLLLQRTITSFVVDAVASTQPTSFYAENVYPGVSIISQTVTSTVPAAETHQIIPIAPFTAMPAPTGPELSPGSVPEPRYFVPTTAAGRRIILSTIGSAPFPNDVIDSLVVYNASLIFNSTFYVGGTNAASNFEADVQMPVPVDVTIGPLLFGMRAVPSLSVTGTIAATVRINGANTSLSLTVPYPSTPGNFRFAAISSPTTVTAGATVTIAVSPNLSVSVAPSLFIVLGVQRLLTATLL